MGLTLFVFRHLAITILCCLMFIGLKTSVSYILSKVLVVLGFRLSSSTHYSILARSTFFFLKKVNSYYVIFLPIYWPFLKYPTPCRLNFLVIWIFVYMYISIFFLQLPLNFNLVLFLFFLMTLRLNHYCIFPLNMKTCVLLLPHCPALSWTWVSKS